MQNKHFNIALESPYINKQGIIYILIFYHYEYANVSYLNS